MVSSGKYVTERRHVYNSPPLSFNFKLNSVFVRVLTAEPLFSKYERNRYVA
jgi:hypothetical protein